MTDAEVPHLDGVLDLSGDAGGGHLEMKAVPTVAACYTRSLSRRILLACAMSPLSNHAFEILN
jgi:hypothetical protein